MAKLKKKTKAESKPKYKKLSQEEKEREELARMQDKATASVLDTIEEELEQEGITLFDNENVDNEYLILPADITEETSPELGKYFNAFTQQKMWTRTVIGRLATTIREMRRSVDDIKSEVYSSLPPKLSIKEKDLRFQVDPRAREILDDIFIYEEKLRMTEDYLENLIDGIVLISREITRRVGDFNDSKRDDNIGRTKRR